MRGFSRFFIGGYINMKNLIYTALQTATTVTAGNPVPVGSIIRKYGSCINATGSAITINRTGYYDVDVNVTYSPVADGVVSFEITADGTPVPGATVTTSAVTTGIYQNGFNAIVRVFCCKPVTLQIVSSGAASPVVSNMSVSVEGV